MSRSDSEPSIAWLRKQIVNVRMKMNCVHSVPSLLRDLPESQCSRCQFGMALDLCFLCVLYIVETTTNFRYKAGFDREDCDKRKSGIWIFHSCTKCKPCCLLRSCQSPKPPQICNSDSLDDNFGEKSNKLSNIMLFSEKKQSALPTEPGPSYPGGDGSHSAALVSGFLPRNTANHAHQVHTKIGVL